ncbi:nephrocystin-3 protein [Ceratobasidium sp. AG-Ba]|nr:nephrocystin-3 protein [Ceratobasidium sp. AG-Ba]
MSGRFDIHEVCQMMAGTGTGALIACMIGLLGMDVNKAITTYSNLIERVFSEKKMISTSGSGTYKANRLEDELKAIVRGVTGDEKTRMMADGEIADKCRIMVFAMSAHTLTASTPRIFRSYQGPNNQMPNCPVWQVVRASMAHPELFKSVTIDDGVVPELLVGGDVGCSNPTRHVLAELSALYPDRHVSSIICIGGGHTRTIQIPQPSLVHRFMPTNILIAMRDVATDCERVAEEMEAQFEGTSVYWRLSVDQGMQGVRVGEWQKRSEVAAHTRAYMQKTEVTKRLQEAVTAIVERKAVVGVRYIGGKAREPTMQQLTGVKRCPVPSAVFTGNERHVSQVANCIVGPDNERRVCVIHGLGGSGKTQVALKSIERTLDRWTDIAYIDATSRDTAESTLKAFALAKKAGETHQDAIRWLERSDRPWLLVFDNADDPDLDLQSLIPGGTNGSVLVTTRLRALGHLGQGPGSECRLGRMDPEEAVELLTKKARIEGLSVDEEEAAHGLDLGYLALAVVHSGAYIWCTETSIAKYRKQYTDQKRTMLERYSKLPANIEDYGKTVYTTWAMSYERLSGRARELLWLLAYLHHDIIREETFERATNDLDREPILQTSAGDRETWTYVKDFLAGFLDLNQRWDSSKFSTLVDELQSYSLINYDRVNDAYSLHVLVQDWARSVIPQLPSQAMSCSSHMLALSIDFSSDIKAHTYQRGLLLHVSQVIRASNKLYLDDAEFFAEVYRKNGRWQEEEGLLKQVLEARKRELGESHPDTLTSMGNLASTYSNQGRWGEAEALEVQVLEVRRRDLGERHPDTLGIMNNLGSTYSKQGRWGEAEALQVRALELIEQELGESHPYAFTSMNNLASTYSDQGRWDEAEALQVQALKVMQQELGEIHPDTLGSMNNLAATYSNQGRWDEAEVLQAQALEVMKQELGERHPHTLTSMNNLAVTYWNQDRWDEAEALEVQVLEGRRRELGESHPDTLGSMGNLASTYSDQGRWDEAEALHVQVLELRIQKLGERHPDTFGSMGNLASTYSNQGRWDEAEALQVQVLELMKQELGESHPDTLGSMSNLASTYSDQGRWGEAEELQVQVLEGRRQHLGESHPDTLGSMNNLASTYSGQGRWDEAEALQVQLMELSTRVLGEHHPKTLIGMYSLSRTLLNTNQLQKAESLSLKTVSANKQVFGDHHCETLDALELLLDVYKEQGHSREQELQALEEEIDRVKAELK